MKKLVFLFALFALTSCSSVMRVSESRIVCDKHSLFGSCEEKLAMACKNGYEKESEDSFYGYGGPRKKIVYKCKE